MKCMESTDSVGGAMKILRKQNKIFELFLQVAKIDMLTKIHLMSNLFSWTNTPFLHSKSSMCLWLSVVLKRKTSLFGI